MKRWGIDFILRIQEVLKHFPTCQMVVLSEIVLSPISHVTLCVNWVNRSQGKLAVSPTSMQKKASGLRRS